MQICCTTCNKTLRNQAFKNERSKRGKGEEDNIEDNSLTKPFEVWNAVASKQRRSQS